MGRLLDEDAVKQALYDAVDDISCGYYEVDGIREGDIEKIINSVPPAQPEQQEGYWIRIDCGLDIECKCSACGYRDFVEPHDTYWFNRNFCPNCGEKKKGVRNATD